MSESVDAVFETMTEAGNDELPLAEIARADLSKISSVYGPVRSWRVGWSLGIDLLCLNSICSFNCVYCQLGTIQVQTNQRQLFVPTAKMMSDLEQSEWRRSDIITFSGSGEPTLALNLGESIVAAREFTRKPVLVLTNGTLFHLPEVRQALGPADRVYLKLDAATETSFKRVNRPVQGVSFSKLLGAAEIFRESYPGYFGLQVMLLFSNLDRLEDYARLFQRLQPDEVQINTPTRPYPQDWYLDSRGSHGRVEYPAKPLKRLTPERIREITGQFKQMAPGLQITCVYDRLSAELPAQDS